MQICYVVKSPFCLVSLRSDSRLFAEAEDAFRTPYQRDRDRIIHSRAFRRLKHKTQVFVSPLGDHYRTRLTHTIEVAQIARTLATMFHCDENLTEAIALAHDLGHPPFGHAGEQAIDKHLLKTQKNSQGFDHNIQTLRMLTQLEKRSCDYAGLNLTKAVIEGTIKHSFPLQHMPPFMIQLAQCYEIDVQETPSQEAQIAGIADDIAYNHHDLDDGLRAGLFTLQDLYTHLPFMCESIKMMQARTDDASLIFHMLIGYLLNAVITDVIAHSCKNSKEKNHLPSITLSPEMQQNQKKQKDFLFHFMYRHPDVCQKNNEGQAIIASLFQHFASHPETLPDEWEQHYQHSDERKKQRIIADYIAGMSDDFATRLMKKIG